MLFNIIFIHFEVVIVLILEVDVLVVVVVVQLTIPSTLPLRLLLPYSLIHFILLFETSRPPLQQFIFLVKKNIHLRFIEISVFELSLLIIKKLLPIFQFLLPIRV